MKSRTEEFIAPSLVYTEETGRLDGGIPVRDCFLRMAEEEEAVSRLNLLSFTQRIGGIPIQSEGIGGVETLPRFRRQGLATNLLNKVIESASSRVCILYVSEAIEGLYEKFGFSTCLAEGYCTVPVRNLKKVTNALQSEDSIAIRGLKRGDLPVMTAMYNNHNKSRTWTHERIEGWDRLLKETTWKPGSEVIILEHAGVIAGYAIVTGLRFGMDNFPYNVDELVAADVHTAEILLAELAARCWRLRYSEFQVFEPSDSIAIKAARRYGCKYHFSYASRGGMMGIILDRVRLLVAIKSELKRRCSLRSVSEEFEQAFSALLDGRIITDERALLKLITGYWSMGDYLSFGGDIPSEHEAVCSCWFPGGGTPLLLQPHSHRLDRY